MERQEVAATCVAAKRDTKGFLGRPMFLHMYLPGVLNLTTRLRRPTAVAVVAAAIEAAVDLVEGDANSKIG